MNHATATPLHTTTIDEAEIAKFSAIAAEWWNPAGKFAPLHRINPVRLKYIRETALAHFFHSEKLQPDQAGDSEAAGPNGILEAVAPANIIAPFTELSAIDIGCGGGLVAEPITRMGFNVTAIDGSEKNIKTASLHAEQSHLKIDYRATTAETLAAEGAQFDLVLALEVIEHVADINLFLESVAKLVKPNGLLIMSTLNRTVKSYAMAIVGAEYILRWLPRGTHDWKKFLKPHELIQPLQRAGMEVVEMQGLTLNPAKWEWQMHPKDIDVNYMVALKRTR